MIDEFAVFVGIPIVTMDIAPVNTILCTSCSAAIDEREAFCPACGAPVGPVAALDPLQAIRAEGFVIQKAAIGKPKPIVLLGVWILFFPCLVVGLMLAADFALNGQGLGAAGFLFFWAGIAIAIFSLVMLFKVTRNYFAAQEPAKADED